MVEELIKKGIADDERPNGGAVVVKIDEKLGFKNEKSAFLWCCVQIIPLYTPPKILRWRGKNLPIIQI
jgi:hypothetical protein